VGWRKKERLAENNAIPMQMQVQIMQSPFQWRHAAGVFLGSAKGAVMQSEVREENVFPDIKRKACSGINKTDLEACCTAWLGRARRARVSLGRRED
jgi:hypothetical protein